MRTTWLKVTASNFLRIRRPPHVLELDPEILSHVFINPCKPMVDFISSRQIFCFGVFVTFGSQEDPKFGRKNEVFVDGLAAAHRASARTIGIYLQTIACTFRRLCGKSTSNKALPRYSLQCGFSMGSSWSVKLLHIDHTQSDLRMFA